MQTVNIRMRHGDTFDGVVIEIVSLVKWQFFALKKLIIQQGILYNFRRGSLP